MVSSALVSRAVADVDAARPPRGDGRDRHDAEHIGSSASGPPAGHRRCPPGGRGRDGDTGPPAAPERDDSLDVVRTREDRRVAPAERAGSGRARRRPVLLRGPGPAAAHPGRSARRRSVPGQIRDSRNRSLPSRKVSPGCAGRTSSRSRQSAGMPSAPAFQLALGCDIRVLADDAKLCMKKPALGLVPDRTGAKDVH